MPIIITVVVSFLLSVLLGRVLIPALHALKAGQSIREIGPKWHNTKQGTPTMGGLMFIAAAVVCVVAGGWTAMAAGSCEHLMVLGFSLIFGAIGFADDFVKVRMKRNLGLTALQKLILQLAQSGKTILVNTLEIPELQKVADRCVVFYHGNIQSVLRHEEISEERVMLAATNAINAGEGAVGQ